MPATFNRKAIMEAAHFMVRWREGNGRTYRERFADALRFEWKKARDNAARRQWNKATVLDCALGLPLRSCPADAKPSRNIFTGVIPARRLYTRQSGRIAGAIGA